ncbi:MAG: SPOR domain-containing protein, partial [Muribaculaceae bacterium]|nr:SPOR domain-containing protein [Muribaculaceae bacterium]
TMAYDEGDLGLHAPCRIRMTREVNGEQVRMTGKFVKVSNGQDSIALKKYNSVVAEFRQLFNANSMAKRLRDAGYDGTFVVETKEPIYYVVVATADTPEEALDSVKRLRAVE